MTDPMYERALRIGTTFGGEVYAGQEDYWDVLMRAFAAEFRAIEREALDRQWQPIETAPRDGTQIMVWCPFGASDLGEGGSRYLAAWQWTDDASRYGWVDREDGEEVGDATHWMPLPEPPK